MREVTQLDGTAIAELNGLTRAWLAAKSCKELKAFSRHLQFSDSSASDSPNDLVGRHSDSSATKTAEATDDAGDDDVLKGGATAVGCASETVASVLGIKCAELGLQIPQLQRNRRQNLSQTAAESELTLSQAATVQSGPNVLQKAYEVKESHHKCTSVIKALQNVADAHTAIAQPSTTVVTKTGNPDDTASKNDRPTDLLAPRMFVAELQGVVQGFVVMDPLLRGGEVCGYVSSVSQMLPQAHTGKFKFECIK